VEGETGQGEALSGQSPELGTPEKQAAQIPPNPPRPSRELLATRTMPNTIGQWPVLPASVFHIDCECRMPPCLRSGTMPRCSLFPLYGMKAIDKARRAFSIGGVAPDLTEGINH
jgi:hypothetical protein